MQNSKILHLSESLSLSSERYLTEAPSESEGPDLVPTSDNVSSNGKDSKFFADNQISGDSERLSADESADKQTDGAKRSLLSKEDMWKCMINTVEEHGLFHDFNPSTTVLKKKAHYLKKKCFRFSSDISSDTK